MKCIIVGAGIVGYSIAEALSNQGHDTTIIDINRDRLSNVEEKLDVQTIEGSGSYLSKLYEAGVENADLLVAVTDSDELNMVDCFLAKSCGVKNTIARVREPDYLTISSSNRQKAMGIDLIINPERIAAQEIAKLVRFPEAQDVDYYADGHVQMLELILPGTSPIVNKSLMEMAFPKPCVIVAIERNDEIIIPRGRHILNAGDTIYILAGTKDMIDIELYIGALHSKPESITILGGGLTGYYLAKFLEKEANRPALKLIEESNKCCQSLAESLNYTMLINGSGTDLSLLEDEGVGNVDIFVAVTNDDKENLLVSILAKHLGAKKTIAQIRRSDYAHLLEKMGIDKAVSPRQLTVAAILKFISQGRIRSLTLLESGRAQMIELEIPFGAFVSGKSLIELNFPEDALIGILVRGDKVLVPKGRDRIYAGDKVIIFALPKVLEKVEEYLTKKH